MKNIKYIAVVICAIFIGVYSCSDDTEYLKYTKGGEVSYTGAIDSLEILPGQNRVLVKGLIIGDPKVTEVRVYWNSRTDSVTVPVNRTSGVDVVETIITGLAENVYNFEVRTFDAQGNSSIAISRSAEVYGDRYIASLFNRPIENNVLIDSELVINFAEMDLSSGVLGSEVEYMSTANELTTVFIDISEESVTIPDFLSGSAYRYRTAFIPDENSIDNFYTAYEEVAPIPTPVLQNAAVPFIAATVNGRWGTLAAPWVTNDAAKNHDGLGGWDEWNGNIFNLESGWGSPWITNGKMYQMVSAEAATYQLKVQVLSTNHDSNPDGSYFVITKGEGIPDLEEVTTATEVIGYRKVGAAGTYMVQFTVDEPGDISVGQVSTQNGDFYCNITSWEIIVEN
ncbi:MAG: DUF4998 domain-containing protein [Flavobacteriaceae bacterium]